MVVDDEADIVHIVSAYLRAGKSDARGITGPDIALEVVGSAERAEYRIEHEVQTH